MGYPLATTFARVCVLRSARKIYVCVSTSDGAQSALNAAARSGELAPFLAAAAAVVARKTGRALFSYPAPQLAELLRGAEAAGLVAKRLRLVHAREDKPARLALIELRAAKPGGLVVEPPLIEWLGRRRSPELLRLSGDRAADRK